MNVKVGDRVIVRGGFGTEPPREVTVEGLDEKNGRPLFDYDNGTRWAYLSQIDSIVQRA